jgi:hypothetical protein
MTETTDATWYVYVRECWQNAYHCHVLSDTKGYAEKCARTLRRNKRSVRVSSDPAFDALAENIRDLPRAAV